MRKGFETGCKCIEIPGEKGGKSPRKGIEWGKDMGEGGVIGDVKDMGGSRQARGWGGWGRGKKKALCGNRRPSNDCLPYEKR